MGWAGQTWIKVTQEGTGGTGYGVFNSGAISAQILYPTINGGDSFTPREVPARQVIRTADAGNRRKMVVANFTAIAGRFNTLIHPDQAAYWITALTSLTSNLLPSYTFDYFDSKDAWRLLGGTCRSATFAWSADQDWGSLSMDWVFQRRDATFTTFAQPAESNYSTLVPYVHVESAGNITVGGAALTKYRSASITINNVLAGTRDELPYISACYYCGRDFDFNFGQQYVTTAMRAAFKAQTPLSFVLAWIRTSPAHSLSFNCETNSYVSGIDDTLPLDGPAYQNINVQCNYDAGNTADFAVTVS